MTDAATAEIKKLLGLPDPDNPLERILKKVRGIQGTTYCYVALDVFHALSKQLQGMLTVWEPAVGTTAFTLNAPGGRVIVAPSTLVRAGGCVLVG